jgi:uncharacterized membrane protein YeiB
MNESLKSSSISISPVNVAECINSLDVIRGIALPGILLMHSIVTSVIFYGDGFALYGELERYQLCCIVAGIWIFQLIASPIYIKYFIYGPAEWIWRSLTYQKLQPFRIKS